MLSLLSLGSGSSGNSAVVYSENSYILVDAGLSAMQLKKRIMESGLDPQKLDAVLRCLAISLAFSCPICLIPNE